ncbi:MAG: serine/threonine protein kinase [Phycisphaerales bacterium]|nr:serine/threonine protein kinase [Phycisphaerales bacterium]
MLSEQSRSWFHDEGGILTELRATAARAAPPTIPGYRDIRELRRGGQGAVYTALQNSTNRAVAIKLLLDGALASGVARRRFEREIDLAAALRHPNIVSIYDSGVTADGRPYLVMEYIEGRPVDVFVRALREGQTPGETLDLFPSGARTRTLPTGVSRVIALFATIAEAIQAAHGRGVIHRDLKPSNIRVTGAGTPVILDFGLAKAITLSTSDDPLAPASRSINHATLSGSGQFLGSLAWASPEQAAGRLNDIDVRTDVYALGVMLYHALTGRFPYEVTSGLRATLEHIEKTEPTKPSSVATWIDDELETIVLRCLAKEPARRYATAADLARDLRSYLAGEAIIAKADSTWYVARKTLRRHRGVFIFAGASIVALAAFSVTMLGLYTRASKAEQSAQQRVDELRSTVTFISEMLSSPDPGNKGRDAKIIDVIDQAERKLRDEATLTLQTRSQLRATLAGTYMGLGQYDKAEALFAQAAADLTDADADPATHVERLRLSARRAFCLSRAGRLDEAEALARQTDQLSANLTDEQRTLIAPGNALGEALGARGKLEDAIAAFASQLEVCRRVDSPLARTTAITAAQNMGVMYRQLDKLDESQKAFEQALALQGPQPEATPEAARLLNNMASLLHSRGKLDQAEQTYRSAIDMMQQVFGPSHDDTLIARSNLGVLYLDLNRPTEAVPVFRELLEISEKAYGLKNPVVLTHMNNLGNALERAGQMDEAERVTRRCAELRADALGPTHPHTMITLGNLSGILMALNRNDEAITASRQLLEAQQKSLNEDSFDLVITRNTLGLLLQRTGKPDEALPMFETAQASCIKTKGPEHYAVGLFMGNRARCLLALNRFVDAEPLARESYQRLKTHLKPNDKRLKQSRETLSQVLRALNKVDEAETIEREAPNDLAPPQPPAKP